MRINSIASGAIYNISRLNFGKSDNTSEINTTRPINGSNIENDTVSFQPKDVRILTSLGIKVKEYEDGTLIISHFGQPKGKTLSERGINENELLQRVSFIEGLGDFRNTKATHLKKLEAIGGNAIFYRTKGIKAKKLEFIGGKLSLEKSEGIDFRNLKSIVGDLNLNKHKNARLSNLEMVGGSIYAYDSMPNFLPRLRTVVGSADFVKTKNLDNLERVKGYARFNPTTLTRLPVLKRLESGGEFGRTIESMPELVYVDGSLKFDGCPKIQLNKKLVVTGNVELINSKLTPADFKHVKVGGEIIVKN